VINVGLRIGPLSVKSEDPGSLGKASLFYWNKLRVMHKTDNSADVVRLMNALNSSQVQRLKTYSPLVLRSEDALGVRKKLAKALNFG